MNREMQQAEKMARILDVKEFSGRAENAYLPVFEFATPHILSEKDQQLLRDWLGMKLEDEIVRPDDEITNARVEVATRDRRTVLTMRFYGDNLGDKQVDILCNNILPRIALLMHPVPLVAQPEGGVKVAPRGGSMSTGR